MKKLEFNSKDIVAFEWHNRKRKFLGKLNFKDLQKIYYNRLFYRDRDEKGRYQRVKIYDEVGAIVSEDNPNGLIGCINFDEEYETVYCKYYEDCSPEELQLIEDSKDVYLTSEVLDYYLTP